jgi:hypothetical protein
MMKTDSRVENNLFDVLMCREAKSFTRSIHGHKGKKIRREAHTRARRTMKILRRIK